jgi:hypothetical protein
MEGMVVTACPMRADGAPDILSRGHALAAPALHSLIGNAL